MSNTYFQFKKFRIEQDHCAMKVTTDGCCFGAWVAAVLQHEQQSRIVPPRMLDIGAGTGLLSLMVAQQNEGSIDAIEIDTEAATQAAVNIAASPWNERINIITADLRDYKPAALYDVIFSNPPFYENELASPKATRNLAHHSTALTLNDVLAFVQQYLKPGGQFFILLPYKRLEAAKQLLTQYQFEDYHILKIRQSPTHDFFRVVCYEPGNNKTDGLADELAITDAPNIYSTAFATLLKKYYLKL